MEGNVLFPLSSPSLFFSLFSSFSFLLDDGRGVRVREPVVRKAFFLSPDIFLLSLFPPPFFSLSLLSLLAPLHRTPSVPVKWMRGGGRGVLFPLPLFPSFFFPFLFGGSPWGQTLVSKGEFFLFPSPPLLSPLPPSPPLSTTPPG